jgi:hypothetical protein
MKPFDLWIFLRFHLFDFQYKRSDLVVFNEALLLQLLIGLTQLHDLIFFFSDSLSLLILLVLDIVDFRPYEF